MNKNTIYLLIAVAMIAILTMGFFIPKKDGVNTTTNTPKPNSPADGAPKAADTAQNINSSLNELMASTVPTKCTYSTVIDSGEGGSMSGTVYVAGGRARSDMEVSMTGQQKMNIQFFQ